MKDFHLFLVKMIQSAIKSKATDIHFLNHRTKCTIKFRIHDALIFYKEITNNDYKRLITYLKFKSHMNLNQSKSPQSSALNIKVGDDFLRIRISTLPSYEGESIVLRINHHHQHESIEDLLLLPDKSKVFIESLKASNGLILITGPTCSGKTTLTYRLLNSLKEQGYSIVTIEDPIEHFEEGFVQLQVNESAGVNYADGVKEILRHDPDVILIGEIRDEKTAKSAIRASLTGHLVISTMHATNCIKALYRFLEFGLSILDLEQTLLLLTNQRLMLYKNDKKIVFEYLMQEKIIEALDSIRKETHFTYRQIDDYLNDFQNYKVMKK